MNLILDKSSFQQLNRDEHACASTTVRVRSTCSI
jgi:hypothetical protein